ncbi:MAG: MerR family transcriptional regulator [Clostridia bacterium]|nr:MerR family transcriptional regulator [Clostridia bacterium]
MKINDVEKITGLSQKAIRLYESKGLISIARDNNGYRNYSDDNVKTFELIKLLRNVGIAITDIKLYLFGVVSIEEIISKRKSQIVKENGKTSSQYLACDRIVTKIANEELVTCEEFTETEEICSESYGELAIGIDIGTTTVSATVIDISNKRQLESYSVEHNSYVCSGTKSEQDVSIILDKTERLLFHLINSYSNICSIGITGQMHGIVYIDKNGNPLSNLINWQDKRGDEILECGKSTSQIIKDITFESIPTGYGIVSHYYNMIKGIVPKDATGICSIMDLFGMRICGLKKPITHTSVAASLGMLDVEKSCFMWDKLSLLNIDKSFLPEVTDKSLIIGKCQGIPVSVAIGDNQASVLGSIKENSESILVNIGTGSQVSMIGDCYKSSPDIESRPFIEGKYLLCGSALCGGYAYSMLESFFRSYTVSIGMEEASQYSTVNSLASSAYKNGSEGLNVDVSFFGKRSDPLRRGSITNIDKESFTPSALALGVLKGMCRELYDLYSMFGITKTHMVASGGAVRKNPLLRQLLKDTFNMEISLNSTLEEAATGAALLSALAIGKIKYENGFAEFISYEEK